MTHKVIGNLVDIINRKIYHAAILVEENRITAIQPLSGESDRFILPGFVDAHIHIESSMLVPSAFARLAVVHGTVGTVSDPHEIANVLGVEGVQYMIDNAEKVPLKINFGAPSCVPATDFETAGATIDATAIDQLLAQPNVKYLAEMMNYPGVLNEDPVVMAKLAAAKKHRKPIDGHAPGLREEAAKQYIEHGISTDHECFTYEEALEKLQNGMKILIREGSAAKNYAALHALIDEFPDKIMLCSDDKHPDDLLEGHIDKLVARAVKDGHDLFNVLRAACINPVVHYGLDIGQLKVGDVADFVVVNNMKDFEVVETYIDGQCVARGGVALFPKISPTIVNKFSTSAKRPQDFVKKAATHQGEIPVIEAIDKEIVTNRILLPPRVESGYLVSDIKNDILKIAVVNRYQNELPAVAFIKGFGLKDGAMASCVGHDSHNIIAVGTNDEQISQAVNLIIEHKGGIAVVQGKTEKVLPLPIAGIMSDKDGKVVAQQYADLDRFAKKTLESSLTAPFMTLSFMALLVIPRLKLSDKGLFDGEKFEFIYILKCNA
ncbi:MAG: adenine deaminase [Bacteroidota bacterium]